MVLAGMVIIGLAFVILRLGFYRTAIAIYIAITAAVALCTPFVHSPNAEIGLLASAMIPVLLTAMVSSYRWLVAVLIAVVGVGTARLAFSSLPFRSIETGAALLITVAITGALILVLRHHLYSLETERRNQIRKTALKYRNLFDNIADGIFVANLSGHIVEANSAAGEQLGMAKEEIVGLAISDITARADYNLDALISRLRQTGSMSFATQHKRRDGSVFPVELRLNLIDHQSEINILGVAHDVTEQQEELSFREAVISNAAEGMCVCHEIAEYPNVKFSLWNDQMYRITGYTMDEINRSGWYQSVYPDPELRARAAKRMSEMRRGNQLKAEEWVITRKDGQERTLEISTSLLRTKGSHEHFLALMHDITERKQFERNLASSERQYRELFDTLMEGIGLVDKDETLLFANPALAKIFEFDTARNMVGKSILDYIAPKAKDTVRVQSAMRANGVSSQYELEILTAKGNSRWAYISVTPQFTKDGLYAGSLAAVLDITEKRNSERLQIETQQKLERAERMESLGLLAGGVAHDLNNMLGPVAGYAELLLREVEPDTRIAGRIQKIVKSAHDAADVIQDLLTLARRGRYPLESLLLNNVIRVYLESPGFEALKQRHPGITVDLNLCSSGGMINGSSPHLSKVIMNLISNAFEAMGQSGTLIVSTEKRHLQSLIGGYGTVAPGEYVLLRVKDSGVGILQEDLDKIFEPYFSRKKMGRSGTGLGLSIVYGVVKDHNGFYDVFSEPGKGTEFILYFPAISGNIQNTTRESAMEVGTGTILVVDDLQEQRELTRDILSSLGYTVNVAENGHEAIEAIKRQPADVVVLDMIMEPEFDGLDAFREILKIRPNQPCIIVSGFAETERVREVQQLGGGPYVRKPFSVETIGMAVREALQTRCRSLSH